MKDNHHHYNQHYNYHLYYWYLNRHLCDLREGFGKKTPIFGHCVLQNVPQNVLQKLYLKTCCEMCGENCTSKRAVECSMKCATQCSAKCSTKTCAMKLVPQNLNLKMCRETYLKTCHENFWGTSFEVHFKVQISRYISRYKFCGTFQGTNFEVHFEVQISRYKFWGSSFKVQVLYKLVPQDIYLKATCALNS